MYFKSLKSGKVFQVAADDIDSMEWIHAARGYEVKVMAKEGAVTKFSGFKDEVSDVTFQAILCDLLLSV